MAAVGESLRTQAWLTRASKTNLLGLLLKDREGRINFIGVLQ